MPGSPAEDGVPDEVMDAVGDVGEVPAAVVVGGAFPSPEHAAATRTATARQITIGRTGFTGRNPTGRAYRADERSRAVPIPDGARPAGNAPSTSELAEPSA